MDEERPQSESGNKGWLKALALLEVGGFEFVFVLVFLVLFFGALNYFNILSLSTIFPQYFSSLPHRPIAQNQSQLPSPSLTLTQMITEQQARKDLEKTIFSSINPAYSPPQLKVFNLIPNSSGKLVTFVGSWHTIDGAFLQFFAGFKNSTFLNNRQILIGIPEESMIEELNSSSSANIADRYLTLKINSAFVCSKVNPKFPKLTLCETTWNDESGIKFTIQVMHPFEKNSKM